MAEKRLFELKALIVEDSQTQSEFLKFSLEKLGLQVTPCYTGKEAMVMLESFKPDIIISDVMMPEMNGYELAENLKSDNDYSRIPIILLTSLTSVEDILKGLVAGADSYIVKPFNEQYLRSVIVQVLDNAEQLTDHKQEDPILIHVNGNDYSIRSNGYKILNVLFSSYESIRMISENLKEKKAELVDTNEKLRSKIKRRKEELEIELAEIEKKNKTIRQSEEIYRQLIDQALVGIISCEADGRIIHINPAMESLLEIKEQGDQPEHFSLLCSEKDWEKLGEIVQEKGAVSGFEAEMKTITDKNKTVSINAFVSGNEVCCMVLDITAKKYEEQRQKEIMLQLVEARDKAAQSESVKTSFLANMSAKILEPLNTITEQASKIIDKNTDHSSYEHLADEINLTGNYLVNLIENTIDIAMIDSGEMKIRKEPCSINILLIDLYSEFQRKIEESGKTEIELLLRREIKDKNFTIRSEPYRLKRILSNLISNSIRYTDRGKIEFGYHLYKSGPEQHQKIVQFYVKDSGKGISEAKKQHLFDRFWADSEMDILDKPDAGFGLTLSKSYVELLGGVIWCSSSPGYGSQFYFSLPYEGEVPAEKYDIGKMLPSDKLLQISGKYILVADESAISFEVLQGMLTMIKVKTACASDGKQLIDMIKKSDTPDLILLDMNTPVVPSVEALTEIRRLKKDLPVVLMHGYISEEQKDVYTNLGITGYLRKPVQPEDLIRELEFAI